MSYECFEKQRVRRVGKETVTILKQGILGLGMGTVEKHFQEVKHATLHCDLEGRKIGIRPEKEGAENAYDIRGLDKKKGAVQISAQAFLRHYGIPHAETKAYPCTWNEAAGLVEIEWEL